MAGSRKPKKDNRWSDIHGGMAFVIPVSLLRHPNCIRLSPGASKLLFDLARQYSGHNNGYLCASWALMRKQGWRAEHTLRKAQAELEHYRIIIRTQQGGRNRPTLLAFTFRRIDEKREKPLDVGPTERPVNDWLEERPDFVFQPKKRRPKAKEKGE